MRDLTEKQLHDALKRNGFIHMTDGLWINPRDGSFECCCFCGPGGKRGRTRRELLRYILGCQRAGIEADAADACRFAAEIVSPRGAETLL